MKFVPRSYQQPIIEHQTEIARGNTWAGMGLGKTVATLTSIDALQLGGLGCVLVLAPLRVAQSTWPDEVRKWDHLSGLEVQPIVGSPGARRTAMRNRNAGVFTINYENIQWLIDTLGKDWPFDMVVCDESTKLKGFRLRRGSKRARALAKIAGPQHTSRWLNLTGTPAPNGLLDVWGQQWFVDQGAALGRTYTAYTNRWFMPDNPHSDYPNLIPRPFADAEIHERLAPSTITIRGEDWFDLRDPVVNVIRVDLPKSARKAYEQMEREMFAEIAGEPLEAMTAAAKTQKCGQLANGAAYIEDGSWREVHDAKIQALESIIDEAAGMPVLVAYNFVSDRERILRNFKQARVLDNDPQTIRDWNAGKIPVLVAHPASAGHGLNLQDGGNILAFFGIDWNLEEHDQIIERIGPTRQMQAGHDRPVFIHYILAHRTVDEIKLRRLETKRGVQELLLEAMRK